MSSSSATSDPSFTPHGGGNAAKSAAAAAAAKQAAKMALAQYYDERIPRYYFVAMGGLILIFSIFHWSRFTYSRYASKSTRESALMKCQVAVSRSFRNILLRQVPGFTSMGHLVLVTIYLAVNISLTVTFVDWSSLTGIGKRCGWMALSNIAFITFLALKNTPLAFLTAYSYERLNVLHQIGGYTTVTYVFLHLTLISRAFMKMKNAAILLKIEQIHAMIAGSAILVTLIAAVIIRRLRYELFYVIHVTMYMLIIINVGFHRPDFADKAVFITIVAGSIWGLDRILRTSKILWYSLGNRATITPLPNGGTRVVLHRSPSRGSPGHHCFVWIPKIRLLETHPFTIVSTTPKSLEFVVAAYDGFTNDLHRYALKHPGISLRASVDGPYGALPNFAKAADRVILVAGGSGASFTFGVGLDLIKRLGISTKTKIDFIWAVKEHEALSWFTKELNELQSSPLVTIHLHTTRARSPSPYVTILDTQDSTPPPASLAILDEGKCFQMPSSSRSPDYDIEKHPSAVNSPVTPTTQNPWDSTASLSVITGRPDVASLIKGVAARANHEERIAIAACGPEGLMQTVRQTAAECIKVDGPSIELHCEQFGW